MRSLTRAGAAVLAITLCCASVAGAQTPAWNPPPGAPLIAASSDAPASFGYATSGADEVAFVRHVSERHPTEHLLVASDVAGVGFGTPRDLLTLPAGADALAPSVDAGGDVFVAYSREVSQAKARHRFAQVAVQIAPAGVVSGAPITFGGAALTVSPSLAVAPDGTAVLAFDQRSGNGRWQAMVSLRLPGGAFSAATAIAGISPGQSQPAVAVDSSGDIAAVWERGRDIIAATGTAAAGLGPAQTMDVVAPAGGLTVAVGDGRTVIAWLDEGGFCGTASAQSGQPFAIPDDFAPGCTGGPVVAVTPDGHALLAAAIGPVRPRLPGAPAVHPKQLQTFVAPPGGDFEGPQTVYTGTDLVGLELAVGPQGDALVAVADATPAGRSGSDLDTVYAAVGSAESPFGPATAISDQRSPIELQAAGVGPAGQLDVAWDSGSGFYAATGNGG